MCVCCSAALSESQTDKKEINVLTCDKDYSFLPVSLSPPSSVLFVYCDVSHTVTVSFMQQGKNGCVCVRAFWGIMVEESRGCGGDA